MGYVKCKAKVTIKNFAELKADYLLEIKQVIAMDEIPAEFTISTQGRSQTFGDARA